METNPSPQLAAPTVEAVVRHRNRIIYINGLHLRDEGIKPLFKWCTECDSFVDCYPDAGGPHFMDPSCGVGPIPIKMPNNILQPIRGDRFLRDFV